MRYLLFPILRKISLLFFVFLCAGRVQAQEERVSKIRNTLEAIEKKIEWEKEGWIKIFSWWNEKDNPYQEPVTLYSQLHFKNKIHLGDNLNLHFSLDAIYENTLHTEDIEDVDILVNEAYLCWKMGGGRFYLGNQYISWGKLDNVILLDRINPYNYKYFILFKKQERKLPIFMLRYNWHQKNYDGEVLLIPFFKPSYLKFFGSDWAVFGHLKKTIEEGSYSSQVKETIKAVDVTREDKLDKYIPKNFQGAVKLRSRIKDIDFDVYYMYIYNRLPTLKEKKDKSNTVKKFLYLPTEENLTALLSQNLSPEELKLIEDFPRLHILGIDFETVAGPYGIRGEVGLFLSCPYLRRDFSYVRKDTLSLGVGIDHTAENNFYWNFQFIEDIILNYEELFSQEEFSHQVTLNLSKQFFYGDLILDLDSSYRISYHDWMLNPQVSYKLEKGVVFSLGGYIFEGSATTLFGRYSDNDLVYFKVIYNF